MCAPQCRGVDLTPRAGRKRLARPGGMGAVPHESTRPMLLRSVVLAALAASLAIGVGVAVADPNPVNNKNAVSRTLECDNGATLAATFAGLEGSDFNIVIDQR